jgi:uncharacterized protein (TIGR01777 family)
LATTIASLQRKPSVFLSGSAIGIYGARGDEQLTETSAHGTGFLADVCEQWEAAAKPAIDAGVRTVFLRTGIVLSPKGGALKKLLPLFRLGVGGKFGNGKQWQSWISMDDEVASIIHLLTANVSIAGRLTTRNLRKCWPASLNDQQSFRCPHLHQRSCLVENWQMLCSLPANE